MRAKIVGTVGFLAALAAIVQLWYTMAQDAAQEKQIQLLEQLVQAQYVLQTAQAGSASAPTLAVIEATISFGETQLATNSTPTSIADSPTVTLTPTAATGSPTETPTSRPSHVPQPTATAIPPSATPLPPTSIPVPPTATSVPPTATFTNPPPTATPPPPPTLTPTPVVALSFNWSIWTVCDSGPDVLEIRVENRNPVDVTIVGFIRAQPDGGGEQTMSETVYSESNCGAGYWCGPMERIRNQFPQGFRGNVWGELKVYYQGNLVDQRIVGPVYLTCNPNP